jgi:hypothetical protein
MEGSLRSWKTRRTMGSRCVTSGTANEEKKMRKCGTTLNLEVWYIFSFGVSVFLQHNVKNVSICSLATSGLCTGRGELCYVENAWTPLKDTSCASDPCWLGILFLRRN